MDPLNVRQLRGDFEGRHSSIIGGQYYTFRSKADPAFAGEIIHVPHNSDATIITILDPMNELDMMRAVMWVRDVNQTFMIQVTDLSPLIPLNPYWLLWRKEVMARQMATNMDRDDQ